VDGVDLGSPTARRRNALDEIRLNRRLAPTVYLGITCLTVRRGGALAIDGAGRIVDWLVRMRRLPASLMLDRLITDRSWSEPQIAQLAAVLARFYADQLPVRLSPEVYIDGFRREVARSAEEVAVLAGSAQGMAAARIAGALTELIERRTSTLAERVERGFVVEGHGDLRPEHVCLTSPPAVIDCLEFRRDLRLLDPWDELTFLAMECARLGAPDIEPVLFAAYGQAADDPPDATMIPLYKGLRAFVRARLALAHLKDHASPDLEKWRCRATDYLEICTAVVAPPG
jgi:aminoglycoside phosphotransferase family enzyme